MRYDQMNKYEGNTQVVQNQRNAELKTIKPGGACLNRSTWEAGAEAETGSSPL